MNPRAFCALVAIGLSCSGCEIAALTARNLKYETCYYSTECITHERCRKLALNAWNETLATGHVPNPSEDYASGFQDGFAEYLERGGMGVPPPMPPRRYWKPRYQTPEGHQAIQEWYAGYAHGAAAARESGLRELIVVPSSVTGSHGPVLPGLPVLPPPMIKPEEVAPTPRPLPSGSQSVVPQPPPTVPVPLPPPSVAPPAPQSAPQETNLPKSPSPPGPQSSLSPGPLPTVAVSSTPVSSPAMDKTVQITSMPTPPIAPSPKVECVAPPAARAPSCSCPSPKQVEAPSLASQDSRAEHPATTRPAAAMPATVQWKVQKASGEGRHAIYELYADDTASMKSMPSTLESFQAARPSAPSQTKETAPEIVPALQPLRGHPIVTQGSATWDDDSPCPMLMPGLANSSIRQASDGAATPMKGGPVIVETSRSDTAVEKPTAVSR